MKSNEEILDDLRYYAFKHKTEIFKNEVVLPAMDEARRESTVGFAEWIESSGAKVYSPELGFWVTAHGTPTTSELYNLYLKNKEK